jgi:MFS family permease
MAVTISQREIRRSFALGVSNGAIFQFAEALIDPPLVLTWFVSQLTSSNLLIGLVAPMGDAGWSLPQIFVSARVQRMRRKMPSYMAAAVVRTVAWLLLTAAVWFLDNPLVLLVAFFVMYAVARVASGLGGLAFFDVVAKTIPARRRGSFFAWRQFLGGLLGLGGGWTVKIILNHPSLPFPRGHAFLFLLYCFVMILGMVALIMVREPPGVAVAGSVTVGEQLRRAGQLLRTDRVFRRYMAARLTLALATVALPFYGIYAKTVLAAPVGMVGIYVATRAGAMLLSNLAWGRLSDRRGNQLVMRLVGLGNAATALLALALVGGVEILKPQGGWLPYLALPLFFLDGAVWPAQALVGSNFLLELAPDAERPLYLGFSNTLVGVAVLVAGLGGLLVDAIGFAGLFTVTLCLGLIAHVLAIGLPEPRAMQG